MTYDELLVAVQRGADLRDAREAERVTTAVLSVLSERLSGAEPAHLAAQLPPELAVALDARGAGERFSVEEFDRRVAERSSGSSETAHRHAAVVLTTVLSAISAGERDDLLAQLPPELSVFVGDQEAQR